MIFRMNGKKYRWSCPQWVKTFGKYVGLSALGLGTFLFLFNVYATAVGHAFWG